MNKKKLEKAEKENISEVVATLKLTEGLKEEQKIKKSRSKSKKDVSEFRLAAKKLFLTYPKCDIEIQIFTDAILNKLLAYGIEDYLVVNELHEDKTLHKHVYISLCKKFDSKSPNWLDLKFITQRYPEKEPQEEVFHGNYQGVKKELETIDYLTKDYFTAEQAIGNMCMSPGLSSKLGDKLNQLSLSERMITLARLGRVDEAMRLLETENPVEFLRSGIKMQRRLQEIHLDNMGFKSKYPLDSFVIPLELREALALFEDAIKVQEAKTFILKGDPGTGKTQFLIAYLQYTGREVYVVNSREGLRGFNSDKHTAILYDDPDFVNETREELIHLVDNLYRSIKIRYTMVMLPSNLPTMIATNQM